MLTIALDPGFGNTKVCHDGLTATIQTAVAIQHSIGLAATGLKTGTVKTIQLDCTSYAVGQNAWLHGEPVTSLDYTALAGPDRKALFFRALSELVKPGALTIDQLVVGLPVPLLQDRSQAEAAFTALRTYKGEHTFVVDGNPYTVTIVNVKVLAQPVGAYADWLIGPDQHFRKGGKDAETAVLDVGLNTLDLYALRGGEVEPRFVAGAKVGVRRLLASLNGSHDMEETDADLRAGRVRASTEQLNTWLSEIMAVVERAWPNLTRFTSVIPTGGGALVLGDLLRNELARRGAAVAWPEDPITANVRGLWKWYSARARKDEPVAQPVASIAKTADVIEPAGNTTKTGDAAPSETPRKRGRPAKSALAVEAQRCTQCGKGAAKEDGICTTCRGRNRHAELERKQEERISAIVSASNAGRPVTARIKAGEVIGGARVG